MHACIHPPTHPPIPLQRSKKQDLNSRHRRSVPCWPTQWGRQQRPLMGRPPEGGSAALARPRGGPPARPHFHATAGGVLRCRSARPGARMLPPGALRRPLAAAARLARAWARPPVLAASRGAGRRRGARWVWRGRRWGDAGPWFRSTGASLGRRGRGLGRWGRGGAVSVVVATFSVGGLFSRTGAPCAEYRPLIFSRMVWQVPWKGEMIQQESSI